MNKVWNQASRWMRQLSSRLMLTYVLLVLASVGGLLAWTGSRLQAAELEQAEHNLETHAQLVAAALRDPLHELGEQAHPGRSLDELVRVYAERIGARVTVVNEHLQVLASSDDRISAGFEENHVEFVAARAGGEQHALRWDAYADEERLFVAAAILQDARAIGFVQLSMPTAPIYDHMRQTWLGLLGVGAIVLCATALVSVWLARSIARPVQTLTQVSQEIAQGHLERRVTPAGPDEIEQLGRTFNRMAERLQELITRQKEFVANAAHELRSPLTSLGLRLELLQNPARTNPAMQTRYLAQMELEVVQLQRVVEQLLALSALDQGEPAPRAALDPAPLLYELADQLSPLVQDAGVRLQVEVPPHLPAVNVNAEQLRMGLRNLLDNAVKYTPAGGNVTLRAGVLNGALEIDVSDTGVGIPAAALPHIFERFYRVDKSRANRSRGSGLGLALARSMIEANAGRIEVTSAPGRGSRFTVRLPLASKQWFVL